MLNPKDIADAVRHERGVSRRLFLGYAAALAATPLLSECARAQATRRPTFVDNPFTLGIASGDPDASGMVLWTRLAPRPLDPDGGMPATPVEVTWEVAEDDAMRKIVKRGTTIAAPKLAHSVHVEVDGLAPDLWYWYRFRASDAETMVGRTRTLPVASAMPDQLRFAFASCQHYEAGFYTAYEAMARDELDLVVHLGDYIYEGAGKADSPTGRRHERGKLMTLDDYRVRHAQYRTDPLLQGMHAKCPWLVTWDDHEVSNNYANANDSGGMEPAAFLQRRAAAYQAYYEAMPLRAVSIPRGPDMLLYRRAAFGRLASFHVLDTRQYRSDQPHKEKASPLDAEALDPNQTVMGERQRDWLKDGLASSKATWNVLAQQVMMGMIGRRNPDPDAAAGELYSMDQWCGYANERIELMRYIADRKVSNPVVLTGDIHANYVNELRVDDREADRPVVASEFVGTSITSGGNGTDKPGNVDQLKADNAGLKFHNRQRGYVRCTVNAKTWQSDYVTIDQVEKPGGSAKVKASFVVEAGDPHIKNA